MTQSSLRRDGPRPCNRWPNRSARPVARFTSTTAKTRPRRCRCPWDTRRLPIRWARNQAHAPDPHVGPYLQKCTSFIRAGWTSALEHDLSTEEERRTIPFYQETARPEKREWLAVSFFSVEGGDWCLPIFRGGDPFTPEDARRLAKVGPYLAKIVSLARKFAAFDARLETLGAGASELRRHRHRRDRPRNANERACARSAWRRLQPRPGSSGGPRSRQQSPTAAAGFVCFACGTRQRSGLCADRRRSG